MTQQKLQESLLNLFEEDAKYSELRELINFYELTSFEDFESIIPNSIRKTVLNQKKSITELFDHYHTSTTYKISKSEKEALTSAIKFLEDYSKNNRLVYLKRSIKLFSVYQNFDRKLFLELLNNIIFKREESFQFNKNIFIRKSLKDSEKESFYFSELLRDDIKYRQEYNEGLIWITLGIFKSRKASTLGTITNVNAPILMIPVTLQRIRGNRSSFEISYDLERNIKINPFLLDVYLLKISNKKRNQILELVEEVNYDLTDFSPNIFLKKFGEILKVDFNTAQKKLTYFDKTKLSDVSIYNNMTLGLISSFYSKVILPIQKIVETNKISQSLRNFISDEKSLNEEEISEFKNKVHKSYLKEDVNYFTELNENQLNALKLSNLGVPLNIQGPPGTGKSHLISSIIVNSLIKKERVLVLAEKRTALNVIYNNLNRENPNFPVLRITSSDDRDKEVLKKLSNVKSNYQKEDDNLNSINKSIEKRTIILQSINNLLNIKINNVKLWKLVENLFASLENYTNYQRLEKIDRLDSSSIINVISKDHEKIIQEFEYLRNSFSSEEISFIISIKDILFLLSKFEFGIEKFYKKLKRVDINEKNKIFKETLRDEFYTPKFGDKDFEKFIKNINKINIIKEKLLAFDEKQLELLYDNSGFLPNKIIERFLKGKYSKEKLRTIFIYWLIKQFIDKYNLKLDELTSKSEIIVDQINELILRKNAEINKTINNIQTDISVKFKSLPKSDFLNRFNKLFEYRFLRTNQWIFSRFSLILKDAFPVILATPEALSDNLFVNNFKFDTLIVDEASQMYFEKLIPGMSIVKKVIIVGDNKQLQPSNYFKRNIEEISEEQDDIENSQQNELDISSDNVALGINKREIKVNRIYKNVIDFANRKNFYKIQLNNHYRSASSSLIIFSNKYFYNNTLIFTDDLTSKFNDVDSIEYIELKNAYRDKDKLFNQKEVYKVISVLKRILSNDNQKHMTIGIIAFNSHQVNKIIDTLTLKEPNLYKKLRKNNNIFIKNLEDVQGDERDIIIISSTFSLTTDGKFLSTQFSFLNRKGGENRINVLITRAKYKNIIVNSVDPLLMKVTKNPGPEIWRLYLLFLKKKWYSKKLDEFVSKKNQVSINPYFGDLVYKYLVDWIPSDYLIKKNVQHSSFLFNFVIYRENKPVLIIEIDEFRHYDENSSKIINLQKNNFLISRGWKILRINSLNWFEKNKIRDEIYDKLGILKKRLFKSSNLIQYNKKVFKKLLKEDLTKQDIMIQKINDTQERQRLIYKIKLNQNFERDLYIKNVDDIKSLYNLFSEINFEEIKKVTNEFTISDFNQIKLTDDTLYKFIASKYMYFNITKMEEINVLDNQVFDLYSSIKKDREEFYNEVDKKEIDVSELSIKLQKIISQLKTRIILLENIAKKIFKQRENSLINTSKAEIFAWVISDEKFRNNLVRKSIKSKKLNKMEEEIKFEWDKIRSNFILNYDSNIQTEIGNRKQKKVSNKSKKNLDNNIVGELEEKEVAVEKNELDANQKDL